MHSNRKFIRAAFDIPRIAGSVAAVLKRGASPAESRDWTASFYLDEPKFCSATLIGPKVMLTAAHCLERDEKILISIWIKRKSIETEGRCTVHPEFSVDRSNDIALCSFGVEVPVAAYERISLEPTDLPLTNKKLLLTGFGCVDHENEVPLKKFLIGESTITALVGEDSKYPNSIRLSGGASLCLGDSGGGAYVRLPPSKRRLIVGVNSRYLNSTSWVSSLAKSSGFVTQWALENKVTICGKDKEAPNCRQ